MIGKVTFTNENYTIIEYGIMKTFCTAISLTNIFVGDKVSFDLKRKETGLEAINVERMI